MGRNNWSQDQLANVLARGHHTATRPAPTVSDVPAAPLVNKLGAKRTLYNGVWYDSKAEAAYAQGLDFKVKAGLVLRWERQVIFSLDVAGIHICKYRLDFKVYYADGHVEYVDVKGQRSGVPYDLFKAKKQLMLAIHGIDVIEQK